MHMHTALFFFTLFFLAAHSASGFEELLTIDCNGDIHFLPAFGAGARLSIHKLSDTYDWFHKTLLQRLQSNCPALSDTEFRNHYAYSHPDFWYTVVTGNSRSGICTELNNKFNFTLYSNQIMSNGNTTVKVKFPPGCTFSDCSVKYTAVTGHTFQAAIKPCLDSTGAKRYWNFVSLTCGGGGCSTLGMLCKDASECDASQLCTSITELANFTGGYSCVNSKRAIKESVDSLALPAKIFSTIFDGIFHSKPLGPVVQQVSDLVNEFSENSMKRQVPAPADIIVEDDDCAPPSTFNTSVLDDALHKGEIFYDSQDVLPLGCSSGNSIFTSLVDFQRNLYKPTAPLTPSPDGITVRVCMPNLDELSNNVYFNFNGICNLTSEDGANVVDCSVIPVWNGLLDSGEAVDSRARRDGIIGIPKPTALPAYQESSGAPVVRLLSYKCDGSFSVTPDGASGLMIQLMAQAISRVRSPSAPPTKESSEYAPCDYIFCQTAQYPPDPTDPNYYCANVDRYCVTTTTPGEGNCFLDPICHSWIPRSSPSAGLVSIIAGGTAPSFNAPIFRSLINKGTSILSSHSKCRATKRGGLLSDDQFKIRFGYLLDFVLYFFTGTELEHPRTPEALGIPFSDITSLLFNISTRLLMPETCTYAHWKEHHTCSFQYTGFQALLETEVAVRGLLKECPAVNGALSGPEISLECVGRFCNVLTHAMSCTSTADCTSTYGEGVICHDFSHNITEGFDVFRTYFGGELDAPSDEWFGFSKLLNDFKKLTSLYSFDYSKNPSNPLKLCSLDFDYLLSNSRPFYNITQWASEQFEAEGALAYNRFVSAWTPTALVGTTGSVGSTTGSVGSTTGSVGSTTGSVGSTTGSVGSTTGSVGSATGSVGSTTGSVGSTTGSVSTTGTTGTDIINDDTTSAAIPERVLNVAMISGAVVLSLFLL